MIWTVNKEKDSFDYLCKELADMTFDRNSRLWDIAELQVKLKKAHAMAVEINTSEITHVRFEPLLEFLRPQEIKEALEVSHD